MDTLHERIIRTAHDNICKGVIEEPRIYFDEIAIPVDGTVGFSARDVFRNGERYPVKIHWMTAAIAPLDAEGGAVDEQLVQQVRIRFTYHGQDLMRRTHVRLPVWHNRPVAAPDSVAFGQSCMRPELPWILSSRDSLLVRVQAPNGVSENAERPATFSITGFGLDTSRPYFRSAEVALDDTGAITPMNPAFFQNDGDEPMIVTECAAHLGAETEAQSPQGDIRPLRVSVQQIGNGTNANWMSGPVGGSDLCPAVLLGTQAGRAIVHQWAPGIVGGPGSPGLYWEPGEGLQLEVRADAGYAEAAATLQIALIGSIVVA